MFLDVFGAALANFMRGIQYTPQFAEQGAINGGKNAQISKISYLSVVRGLPCSSTEAQGKRGRGIVESALDTCKEQ